MRSQYQVVRWALLLSLLALVLVALGGGVATAAQGDPPAEEAIVAPQSDAELQGLPPGDATRFRGYVLMGYPDAPGKGMAGVVLKLYGRNTAEPRPGQLLQQRVTDGSGFFNFYLLPIPPNQYDYYLLEVEKPAGYVPTGAWSENGTVLDKTHVEWLNPGGPANFVHMNRFYFVRGYELTILHTNDFHARVEEYQASGASCTAGAVCLGGSSRIKTVVDEVRRTRPNVLLVDAGDQFQGTLYYGLFRSAVIAQMMNAIGYDAMTVGNHEFDQG
ncbi:MAG: metallophosphoesterase, partial [Anaerolineae bacterium]|nr:metallophosphoesterase [Anaerolineae bacterium]